MDQPRDPILEPKSYDRWLAAQNYVHAMQSLYFAVALTASVGAALAQNTAPPANPVVEASSLTDDQLRDAIVGKTVYLSISGFELPIRYKANGRMTGSMGEVAATFSRGDGSLIAVAGASRLTSYVSVG